MPAGYTLGQRLVDLDDMALDVAQDQLGWAALVEHAAAIDQHDAVAQPLRLVHVVGGQQQRLAGGLQRLRLAPDQHPRLRIEAGGRLVEDDESGSAISERAITSRRFMPPDSCITWASISRSAA